MYRRNVERLFFAVAIFGIAAIAVLLPQLYDRGLDIAEAGDGSLGDPWTVCAAGCDYTTLTAAFADVSVQAGDYINVNATYASSTETFPLDFNDKQNITVSCQSSGAVVGTSTASQVDIQMTSSSAFNDCNLSNTRMYFDGVSSATISGNTFATSTTGTIYFTSTGGSGNTISNNTGINNIVVGSNQQSLTITSNTIQTYHSVSNTSTVYISNIENFTFTSNTVRSYDSSVNNLLSIRNATSSLISYNTFEYITAPAVSSPKGALYISDSTSSTISYNYILLDQSDSVSSEAIYLYASGTEKPVDALITHNTMWMYDGGKDGIHVSDQSGVGSPGGYFTVTSTYNIFYNATSSAGGNGLFLHQYSTTSTYAITNDYNGYYNLSNNISGSYLIYDSLPSVGTNSLTTNPYFKRSDVDSANDKELAPFSFYLDINGSEDIGAYSGTRGSSFTVDDDCTVDYSSCHVTSTTAIAENAVDGDTWTIAAGSYDEIRLSTSSRFTGDITIDGAGVSTIINANTPGSAVQLTGLDSTTIQNIVVQQASSTITTYDITALSFEYGGVTYDTGQLMGSSDCSDFFSELPTSGTGDVTSLLGMGTESYHIFLGYFTFPGKYSGEGLPTYIVMLVPTSIAADQSAFDALPNCSLGDGTNTDVWIDTAFTISGSEYTYDSTSVTAAGVSVTSGYTTPALTKTITGMAGVRFYDTTNSTISNVTSTGNYYGMSFEGTTGSNTVSSSAITSSVTYDVFSSSTLNNTFNNVLFTNTSSSLNNVGLINVAFRSRTYVKNESASPIAGVDVGYYSNGNSVTTAVTTAADGYTPYTSMLLSYVMSSSSVATTNGGYNPYTVVASATTTYGETQIANTNLDTQNELFTITMNGPPNAPTGLASTTVATTSVGLTWTDNSADEDAFYIGYTSSTFPSLFVTTTADTTSTSITDLSINTPYTFRVASQKSGSNSSYDTLGPLYTYAQPAGTVSVSTNGTNSLTVSWGANGNPDTTEYYVSNVTNGGSSTWATSTSRTFDSLDAGTSYTFTVIARNGDGIETASSTGSGSTQSGSGGASSPAPSPETTPTSPPDTPTCDPETQSCEGSPPSAPDFYFKINNGSSYTNTTTVTLSINDTYPEQIMVSTSSLFTGASYQGPTASLPFTLSTGDGTKTIYIKFKKTVDGTAYSFTSSTSIILDTQPPQAPIVGEAKSGIENGKIVGQPLFSGVAEPGATIRVKYADTTANNTAGLNYHVENPENTSFLLAGRHVSKALSYQRVFLLAGVIGNYYTTADDTGYWEITFPLVTTPGDYVISVASIDNAGNVSDIASEVAFTVPENATIVGCTDSTAVNYNPNATEDDGSCQTAIPGCTDATAFNYAPEANTDDGSCTPVVFGCRDRSATNYNPQANTSNNSCTYAPVEEPVQPVEEPQTTEQPIDTTEQTSENTDTADQTTIGGDTTATGGDSASSGGDASSGDVNPTGSTSGGSGNSKTALETVSTTIKAFTDTVKDTSLKVQSFVSSTKAVVIETVTAQVQKIAKVVPEPVKKAAKKVQEVADDPQVEEANQQVVAPAVAVAGTANVAVGFQLPQLLLFLRYLFTQPLLLLRRRRQKQWGTIYNVYTKQPIDLATIRIIDAETNKIIRSQVTDQKGRYYILLPEGSYRIEIEKSGFTQKSEMLSKQHADIVYNRVYQSGSVVYISKKRTELNMNIPLEPLAEDKSTTEIIRVYSKQVTQYILSTIGLYISILSYLVSPTRFVGTLVILHLIFLYTFRVLSKRIKRKGAVGIVRDALNKHKLGRVVVRIFDATYNKLVETVVTDYRGRYGALVGPSTYYVTYDKPGYEKKKSPELNFAHDHDKTAGGIIARDERLFPVSEGTPLTSKKETEVSTTKHEDDPTRTLVKDGNISEDDGQALRDIAQYGKGKDS